MGRKGSEETGTAVGSLTTGQAAKLCNVKPDTILKWVKSGKIEALRTQGGHFRIAPRAISHLLQQSCSDPAEPAGMQTAGPLHCWEYLGEPGVLRDGCKKCIVYQCHSAWCFRLKSARGDCSHTMLFCTQSCDDCAYYRRITGLPTQVMLVTTDEELIQSLRATDDPAIELHSARNAYEASAAISGHHPSFALVDKDSLRSEADMLVQCLSRDPRVPGLKVALCTRTAVRAGCALPDGVARVIHKPFTSETVRSLIESFPVAKVSTKE